MPSDAPSSPDTGSATPGRGFSSWRHRHLAGVRRQLTVAAVGVLAVALVAGTLLLLTLLQTRLDQAQHQALHDQVAGVARVVALRGVAEIDSDDQYDPPVAAGVVQVVDEQGRLVFSSRSTGRVLSHLRPEVGQWMAESTPNVALFPAESPMVLATGLRHKGTKYVVIGVAPRDGTEHAVATTATLLAIALPFLLLLAGVATWWLTGRALRPVEDIRREVEHIEFGDLTRRVRVPSSDDEVAALAVTMNDMLARLERSQHVQRRFVADASHELRSPLATLAAGIEVGADDHEAWPDLTEPMAAEVVRMRRLVDDLLLLARVDDHHFQLARDDVDLDDIVQAEAARLRRQGRCQVRAEIEATRVTGDHDKLTQVLRNLCDNAERAARESVTLSVRPEGDQAVVVVRDDGPGIPAADLERVFDRFVRLDDDRARSGGGAGLGLAIVAEIVAAHGGTVRAQAPEGGGARFEVTLPI